MSTALRSLATPLLAALAAASCGGSDDPAITEVTAGNSTDTTQVRSTSGELQPADALARMRYESVLGQLYDNKRPPIDELLAVVVELGRNAQVVDGSLGFDGTSTTAQVLLNEVGLEASLTAGPRGLKIYLLQAAEAEVLYTQRSLRIGVEVDGRGDVASGYVAVVHHFDVAREGLLFEFGDETKAVGWTVTGNVESGLRADPTLARKGTPTDGSEPTLIVGSEASGQFEDPNRPTAVVRPAEKDVRAWEPWRALHAELSGG